MALSPPCIHLSPLQWPEVATGYLTTMSRGRLYQRLQHEAPRHYFNRIGTDQQHEFDRPKYSQLLT